MLSSTGTLRFWGCVRIRNGLGTGLGTGLGVRGWGLGLHLSLAVSNLGYWETKS